MVAVAAAVHDSAVCICSSLFHFTARTLDRWCTLASLVSPLKTSQQRLRPVPGSSSRTSGPRQALVAAVPKQQRHNELIRDLVVGEDGRRHQSSSEEREQEVMMAKCSQTLGLIDTMHTHTHMHTHAQIHDIIGKDGWVDGR